MTDLEKMKNCLDMVDIHLMDNETKHAIVALQQAFIFYLKSKGELK